MDSTCKQVNVIILGSTVTALDEYVVLAFFLSLLLTVLIIILLVKYVTYYMQKDRRRIQHNIEVQHLPRGALEEEDESDSSIAGIWSDEEDAVDIEVQSIQSEEISIQDLDTNYISEFSGRIDLNNNRHRLLEELLNKEDALLFIPNNSLAGSLFPDLYFSKSSESEGTCNILYDRFMESQWLRESLILQHLDFIMSLLSEMHFISQENNMKLLGKYEQEIEDHSADLSVAIGHIVTSLADDLKNIGNVNEKSIEKITNCLHSIHLDSLKCSAPLFSSVSDFINDFESVKMDCIIDMQCYYMQIRCRVCCLQKFVGNSDTNKIQITEIMNNYKEKVLLVLRELISDFNSDLENMIWQIRKHRTDELGKILIKHKRDFTSLKYEILKEKQRDIGAQIDRFTQYIILLHKEYLNLKNQVVNDLNQFEELQVKRFYKQQFRSIISRVTKLEEQVLLSLQDKCNYTEENIVSLTKDMQEYLKEVKQKCIDIKKHVTNNHSILTKKLMMITSTFIDYSIKTVSSQFRLTKDAFKSSFKQVPLFTGGTVDNLMDLVQKRFSVVVYDMVMMLVKDIIRHVGHIYNRTESNKPCINILSDLEKGIIAHGITEYTISVEQLICFLPADVGISDFPLEKFVRGYQSVISDVLGDTGNTLIEEEIEPLIATMTSEHYEKQCEIYESIEELLSHEENMGITDKNKSKKYLSKKGSSYSAKTKSDELYETYASLLGMKETKLEEIYNMLQNERILNTQKKDKTTGITSCIAVLKSVLDFVNNDTNTEYFSERFKCEQDYMIRRFEKKIELMKYDKQNDSKKDGVSKKMNRGPSLRSRNVVSPESLKEHPGKRTKIKPKK